MWQFTFSDSHLCYSFSVVLQSSCDKSSKACTRRIMHMMKNPETVQNVNLYLNEAQTDKVSINYVRIFVQISAKFL